MKEWRRFRPFGLRLADVHRIVIVGGGMAGLAAAWELSAQPGLEVHVLEAGERVGGKLRQEQVGGHWVDVGAESMLATRPEAKELLTEIGAAELITTPVTTAASVWSRGRLHPMPPRSLLGIPRHPEDARGVLDAEEVARVAAYRPAPPLTSDVSVGDYLADAFGDALVDRLVEPLLGGVYAGHARRISLAAALPAVHAKAIAGESILPSDGPALPAGATPFIGLAGGVGRFPALVADALRARGVRVRTGVTVRELRRDGACWAITGGPVPHPVRLSADAVLIALPPPPARRLLAPHAPVAAQVLGGIELASMVVLTYAAESTHLPTLAGSGFLVPPVEGRAIKASTFSSAKWGWLAQAVPTLTYLRASIGRAGEEAVLQASDDDLLRLGWGDLSHILGGALPEPVAAHVHRWGGGLPQYAVGHMDRIALLHREIESVPGVEVAGAAYQGVGIPAVIGSGRDAARRLLAALAPVRAADD